MFNFDLQYKNAVQELVKLYPNSPTFNKRTNQNTYQLAGATFYYTEEFFPILTLRKINWRGAIAEMLGYLRGYTELSQFHELGVKTWDANANHPDWLNSIYNKNPGESLGLIYGACANELPIIEYGRQDASRLVINPTAYKRPYLFDLLTKIKNRDDDRGLIWNMWKPEYFHLGCLRPCMYEHAFVIIEDAIHLFSNQRSCDMLLGGVFNSIQVYFLLWIASKLSGLKMGMARHTIYNAHIYENQVQTLLDSKMLDREPYTPPVLTCRKEITIESVLGMCEDPEDNLHPSDFDLVNYQHHGPVKFPFTV